MLQVTLADNQKVTISANPRTQTGNPTGAFNFGVTNPDTALLQINIATGPNPNPNPTFDIVPKIRFFGPDRIVTLKLTGMTGNGGVGHNTDMQVTVTASLPDDGLLDHFDPTAAPPVPQP